MITHEQCQGVVKTMVQDLQSTTVLLREEFDIQGDRLSELVDMYRKCRLFEIEA